MYGGWSVGSVATVGNSRIIVAAAKGHLYRQNAGHHVNAVM